MGRKKYSSQEAFEKARVNQCGYRLTLKDKVHYKKCPKCGTEMVLDKRRKAYTKSENCMCGGEYGSSLSGEWPHRKGTFGCTYYTGPYSLEEESHL